MSHDPPAPAPALARLLAIAYRSLIDGLHERLRAGGWDDVRPTYGFVLLAARRGPITSTELGVLMGTTKQAASKLVDSMEIAGYVTRGSEHSDARRRPVVLTDRGRRLLDAVESIYAELEATWAEVIGRDRLEQLRADLAAVVTLPDGALPPVRPPS